MAQGLRQVAIVKPSGGPTLSDSPYLEQPPREVVGELRVRTALLGAVTVHTFERGNSRRDPQRGGLCRIGG